MDCMLFVLVCCEHGFPYWHRCRRLYSVHFSFDFVGILQEVDIENRWIVVDVLCNASAAYAHQWKILRAEDLAVEAVQQAK